jgi:hypothetical protein
MKKFSAVSVLLVFALLTSACSFSINIPEIKTGETQEMAIREAAPSTDSARLTIEMGAGTLRLAGGSNQLVEGSVRYNVADWKPEVLRQSNEVRLSQNSGGKISVPTSNVINDWQLELGNVPMELTIQAGAYQGTLDLSGVPLTNLTISDGASEAQVIFDSLNPVRMGRLVYKTGASSISLVGLANANFDEMKFEGGAGSYTLDFTGELQRDTTVKLTAGLSTVKVLIPENLNAVVKITGGINNVSAKGTWTVDDDTYENRASGPTLTILVEMGIGNLQLVKE